MVWARCPVSRPTSVATASTTCGKRHNLVDLAAMHHLMYGLSFKVSRCADDLEDAHAGFNDETRVPERISAWRKRGEDPSRFPTIPVKGRLIAEINQSFEPSTGQMFCACNVRGEEKDPQ